MKLYHATHRSNLDSISQDGLDPGWTQRDMRDTWLCRGSRVPWAILHVAKRHSWDVRDVVVLEVIIPRQYIKRRRAGVWSTECVIPIERLQRCYRWDDCEAIVEERAV